MKFLFSAVIFCFFIFGLKAQDQRTLNLEVRQLKQDTDYYSGPASAEAVLRYFGLTPETIGINSNYQNFQMFLSNFMWTDMYRGTDSFSWWKIVNYFIKQHSLNEERAYNFREVDAGYSNSREFYEIVTRSLLMNVPVVVAFKGIAPHSPRTSGSDNHFIVITGVSGPPSAAVYMYVEPGDGTYRVFGNDYLPILFAGSSQPGSRNLNPSHIFAHLSSTDLIYINAVNSNNQYSGSTHCGTLTFAPFIYAAYGENGVLNVPPLSQPREKLRRFKRSEESQEIPPCSSIDTVNPFSNPNDQFHVWFRLFTNNGIEIRLTRETAISLMRIFIEHDRTTFLRYAKSLMAKIKQLGNRYDSDHEHAAQILHDGMTHIHNNVLMMKSDEETFERHFVFIRTYRKHDFEQTVKKLELENTVYVAAASRA